MPHAAEKLSLCTTIMSTAKWFSYTCIYSFSYSFPSWFITGYWIYFPVLYSRTLSIHSICNLLHLLTQNSQSSPSSHPFLLAATNLFSRPESINTFKIGNRMTWKYRRRWQNCQYLFWLLKRKNKSTTLSNLGLRRHSFREDGVGLLSYTISWMNIFRNFLLSLWYNFIFHEL